MLRMKPRFDREAVLRYEARRRAISLCTCRIPELLRDDEMVTDPIREGDRIVLGIVRKTEKSV